MAEVYYEGFEGGTNGAAVTTSNTGYDTISGTVTFDNSTVIAGTYSGKCAGNGSTAAFVRNVLASSVSSRYFRRYMRVSALPTGSNIVTICRVRTSGGSDVAQIVLRWDGRIEVRDGGTIVATTTNTITLNSWFRWEWFLNSTGSNQEFRLFTGAALHDTTPTETETGSYTGGTFARIEEGGATTSYVGNIWIDEVSDNDSTWPGPSTNVNSAPVANAGPDQNVAHNTFVQLDGTGSTDDGTITDYLWSQISGTSVTLSSTTASQPTFTAPGSDATLVFGLVVTDNDGVDSTQDTVTINVTAVTTSFTENFTGGTNGATITSGNTGYSTITGTATFDNTTRINDGLSAKLVASGSGSLLRHTFTATNLRYFRRYYRVTNFPDSGNVLSILRVRNSGGSTMSTVELTYDGIVLLKNGSSTVVGTGTMTPQLNRWFRVELELNATNSTQTVRLFMHDNLNGATPSETLTGAYTGGTFDRCEEGAATNSFIGTVWVDAVADGNGWLGPASDANQLPVADAGTDQNVYPYDIVTLDGTGTTDAEGSVSYSWQQLSGESVSLSSTTVSQPTFTAPALEFGAALTFELTVTDSGNHTDTDTVTVLVEPATEYIANSGNWEPYETRHLQSGSWQ